MKRFTLQCLFWFLVSVTFFHLIPEAVTAQSDCSLVLNADVTRANVRASHSKDSAILGVVGPDDALVPEDAINGFYLVYVSELGHWGWISGEISTLTAGCGSAFSSTPSKGWDYTEFETSPSNHRVQISQEQITNPLDPAGVMLDVCVLSFDEGGDPVDIVLITPDGFELPSPESNVVMFLPDRHYSLDVRATFNDRVVITTNVYPVFCKFTMPVVSEPAGS